ncbi:MAG: XdhC family protein, partial [Gammaproteobacteria bacterium]|nr:XdhC family protein [Gammaproteobacteria bacterium]
MTDQADDIEVLEAALAWLQTGHQVALATVIRTWGSSPRAPGSLLAMNDAGQFVGSVSGGCVEDSLLARYRDGELAGPAPTMVDFGVDRQQASRMGLPCGGRLEVLIEQLSGLEAIAPLLEQLRAGVMVTRRVSLATGDVDLGEVDLQQGDSSTEFQLSDTALVKTFGPGWQLLLIGDGQLARHLASMALHLDYRVFICDPRENFAPLTPLAEVTYNRLMPDDAVQGLTDLARTAIVT